MAIYQVVNTAPKPTHIVSDCESVVNCIVAISHDSHGGNHKGDHADVWKNVREQVAEKQLGYFKTTWVPSNTQI